MDDELIDRLCEIFREEFTARDVLDDPPDPHRRRRRAMRAVVDEVLWSARDATAQDEKIATLSPAERRVLEPLAEGLTYKQIALKIGCAESTVRTHLHFVYEKLGVADRGQATAYYLRARDRALAAA